MDIDFDPLKSNHNREQRGVGFTFAAQLFLGRTVETFARPHEGEVRMKAIGTIEGVCYAVIFVDRGEVRRIISARRANRR